MDHQVEDARGHLRIGVEEAVVEGEGEVDLEEGTEEEMIGIVVLQCRDHGHRGEAARGRGRMILVRRLDHHHGDGAEVGAAAEAGTEGEIRRLDVEEVEEVVAEEEGEGARVIARMTVIVGVGVGVVGLGIGDEESK